MATKNSKAKYKNGDMVVCTFAGSQFYKVGEKYEVTEQDGKFFVTGSDGFKDNLLTCVSKFNIKT